MAQLHKFRTARIAGTRVFKHFFRLEIEEAHAHRAAAKDSFEMAPAAAATETLFRVQCDHGVAAFPHPFARGIPAEADAVAERPHPRKLVQFAVCRGDARGHGVGIIEDANGNARGLALERSRKRGLQREPFHLLQVWGFFDHAAANDSGEADAKGFDLLCPADLVDKLPDRSHHFLGVHGLQGIERLRGLREKLELANDLVALDQARRDMLHHQNADRPAHRSPAHFVPNPFAEIILLLLPRLSEPFYERRAQQVVP
jgi:hypothetical protein